MDIVEMITLGIKYFLINYSYIKYIIIIYIHLVTDPRTWDKDEDTSTFLVIFFFCKLDWLCWIYFWHIDSYRYWKILHLVEIHLCTSSWTVVVDNKVGRRMSQQWNCVHRFPFHWNLIFIAVFTNADRWNHDFQNSNGANLLFSHASIPPLSTRTYPVMVSNVT